MSILVVDDDEPILTLVEVTLRRKGYQVIKARNAASALKTVETVTPELFILDIMMPGMNGFELCKQLRNQPQFAMTPIIVLSAMTDRETVRKCMAAGVDLCLGKFEIATLADTVEHLLRPSAKEAKDSHRTGRSPLGPIYSYRT